MPKVPQVVELEFDYKVPILNDTLYFFIMHFQPPANQALRQPVLMTHNRGQLNMNLER